MADDRRRNRRDEGFLASVAGIPWGDGRQVLADDEVGLLDAALEPKLAACAQCGAGELEHFYTSKRNGKTLCTDCFQHRVERGLARRGQSAAP